MTYTIDGKRISQYKRPKLLVELERVDRERIRLLARVTEALADEAREVAMLREEEERANLVEAQRDQAVAELDAVCAERDFYKKESVNNWLKLTTSETELGRQRALVVAKDRRIGELERQTESMWTDRQLWWAVFWTGLSVTAAGALGVLLWA